MQTLLTAEDLPKNFDLGEEEHSQITGSTFFIQYMYFAIIPYNSNFYIFDSHTHGRDSLCQSSEKTII